MAKEQKQPDVPQLVKKIVTCECGKQIEVWLELDVTDVMNAIAAIGKMGKGNKKKEELNGA